MTGLQLILSVAAAFCLPGFGQLYQYSLTKQAERFELGFKIQVVCAVTIGLSMLGVGLLFSWFVIPIAWLIGFGEALLWTLKQPQAPVRPTVVLLALCAVLGGGASASAATTAAPQLQRCDCGCQNCGDGQCVKRGTPCCQLCACAVDPADETFDPLPALPPAKQPAASPPATTRTGTYRTSPYKSWRRGGWFRRGCRRCG